MPERIAIVRLSALGDVTLMVPVVRSLREALPEARITWIIDSLAHSLVEGLPGVEFLVIDKPRRPRDYLDLRRRLAGRRFDVLLAMQANLRVNLIYPLIRAPRRIGFDRRRAREGQWLFTNERIPFAREHLLDSFFAFAERLGAERRLRWELPVAEDDRRAAEALLPAGDGPLLVVHPAASKAERSWLPERYAEVIRACHERWGARVALSGGGGAVERALCGQIARLSGEALAANLCGLTRPRQLAALLGRADAVLVPDTGPAHIAAAMGTPVVGLYAVAPAWLSAPAGRLDYCIDRYPEAVRRFLGKDPESVPWGTRVHDPRAMALIEVDEVLERLRPMLERADHA